MIFTRKSSHQTHKNKTKKTEVLYRTTVGMAPTVHKKISAYGQNKPTSITLILTAVKQVYQSMEHRMLSSTNQIQLYVTKLRLSQKSYFSSLLSLYYCAATLHGDRLSKYSFSSSGLTPQVPQTVYQYFSAYSFLLSSFSFPHFLLFGAMR